MSNTIQVTVFLLIFIAIGFGIYLYQGQDNNAVVSPVETIEKSNENPSEKTTSPETVNSNSNSTPQSSPEFLAAQSKVQQAISDEQTKFANACDNNVTSPECALHNKFIVELSDCLSHSGTAVSLDVCTKTTSEQYLEQGLALYQASLVSEQTSFITSLDEKQQGHITAINPTNEMLKTLPQGESKKSFSWSEENEQGVTVSYIANVTYVRSGNSVTVDDAITTKYGTNSYKRSYTIE